MYKIKMIFKWFMLLLSLTLVLLIKNNWSTIAYPFSINFYFKTVTLDYWMWFLICFLSGFFLVGIPLFIKNWKLKFKLKKMQKLTQVTQEEQEPLEE